MQNDPIAIRSANPHDASALVAMTRALAAYHGDAGMASVTAEDYRRDGFGERPLIWCWIAETAAGEPVGFVQLCQGYAAWRGSAILMVSNLYVDERLRGGGLGRRLLAVAARHTLEQGLPRLELHVAGRNPARDFYERVGFRILADLRCRIEGDELHRLAAHA